MSTLKILIAEDHDLVRVALNRLLGAKRPQDSIEESKNGVETLIRVEQTQPDIIFMDVDMPLMDGITATKFIKIRFPHIKIIMLTSLSEEKKVLSSLAAGANAYCLKDIDIDRLIQVMEMVEEGGIWLDPAISKIIMNQATRWTDNLSNAESDNKLENYLTQREMEVLKCMTQGQSNSEIANSLSISINTVKTHIQHILEKMSVEDRIQAVVKAVHCGI